MTYRARVSLAALLCASLTVPVLADPQAGEKASDVHAEKWFNSKSSVSLRRLRGKIVLIEFFECGDSKSIKDSAELIKLHKEMKDNGVVFIGLTEDTPERTEKFLAKYKKPYAVGAGSRTRQKYTNPKIPWYCVVDPDSKIAHFHHEIEEIKKALEAAMEKTPPKPDEEMAKIFEEEAAEKLKDADKLYKAKRLPDALDAYSAIYDEFPNVPTGKKARTLANKVRIEFEEKTAGPALVRANADLGKRKYDAARKEYERIVDKWPDTPSGKKAQEQLDRMHKDPSFSKNVKEADVAKKCKNLLELARNLVKSERFDEARRKYKTIIDTYPNTTYAETAKIEMDKLPE